jgi:UDP-N-acetylmuramoyl-tripeptide--D-alanyl-D-alanine ligase
MKPTRLSRLAKIVGGQIISGSKDVIIRSVSIDSRSSRSGDLFVCLPGKLTDGHKYIFEAQRNGAAASLVTKDLSVNKPTDGSRQISLVKVNDGLIALQKLANFCVQDYQVKVIGITGSTGKTSTKDFLASILSIGHEVVASQKNYNNEIGLPLTILNAKPEVEFMVLEMAMRGPGQIGDLARIAKPLVGVVTNIGPSHMEFFNSEFEIAKAKAELLASLPSNGLAVINRDSSWFETLKKSARSSIITFGINNYSDCMATEIALDKQARASFVLNVRGEKKEIHLAVPGPHLVYNALAAASVAVWFGIDMAEISAGLSKAKLSKMRMEVISTDRGLILNDAYNANPTSVLAALKTVAEMRVKGRKVAVLGDMAELGSLTNSAHFKVGKEAAKLGIDLIIAVGSQARNLSAGALSTGFNSRNVKCLSNKDEVAEFLSKDASADDLILIKASRCMEFEAIVEKLSGGN